MEWVSRLEITREEEEKTEDGTEVGSEVGQEGVPWGMLGKGLVVGSAASTVLSRNSLLISRRWSEEVVRKTRRDLCREKPGVAMAEDKT